MHISYCFLHASCFSNLHYFLITVYSAVYKHMLKVIVSNLFSEMRKGMQVLTFISNKGRKHPKCSSQILRQIRRLAECCWRAFMLNFSWWVGQERFPVLKQTILSYFWGAQKASWRELNSTLVCNGNQNNISEKTLFYPLSSSMYFRVKLDWIRFGASCVSLSLNWLHSSDWKI